MDVGQYRRVLAVRDTRNALALGLLIRIPMFAGTVLLTLHVVTALGRSVLQAEVRRLQQQLAATRRTLAAAERRGR